MSLDLAVSGLVHLAIYDIAGRRLRTLLDRNIGGGLHDVVWDGRDDGGRTVGAGVYLVRLEAGSVTQVRKAVVVR
jgi:flagellar hook assembly protein FlgD